MEYPYLGQKEDSNGKKVVIMFTDVDEGTVVLNETANEKYRFGKHDNFKEAEFDFFPSDAVVRIQN
jgi:hypothetical protein